MVEIFFYYSFDNDPLNFLPFVVEKSYASQKKTLIYSEDSFFTKEINSKLWSYSQLSFIPHLIFDEDFLKKEEIEIEEIPIIIATSKEIFSKSFFNYQIFFDASFSYIKNDFYSHNFEKIIYLIKPFNNECLKKINNLISYYHEKKIITTSWIQLNKKWEKKNDFFFNESLKIAS